MDPSLAGTTLLDRLQAENRELRAALEAAAKEIKDLDTDVAQERAKHQAAFNAGLESARQASVYREQLTEARVHIKGNRQLYEAATKELEQVREELVKVRRQRDDAHHVIIECGIGHKDLDNCGCEECERVRKGMQKAGYLSRVGETEGGDG